MFYLSILLCVLLLSNGGTMLLAPESWYATVPGVADSGPLNPHFARDIGIAYVIAGFGVLWRLLDPLRGWPFMLAGALFLGFHAVLHLVESLSTTHHSGSVIGDVFGIYLPAGLALWLSRPAFIDFPGPVKRIVARLVHAQINRFEHRFDYDGSYMHDMAAASMESIYRFSVQEIFASYRHSVPAAPWFAVKLAGTISEDCGPCTQLVVRMAEAEGVAAQTLEAIVSGQTGELDPDTRLACKWARAVLARTAEAEDYQREITQRWGQAGLIALAFALTSGRIFPQIKYALGYGKVCGQIQIGASETSVATDRHLAMP